MSKRFAWLLGLVGLILTAFLIACGTSYKSGTNGLVIVGSFGSGVLETFSFDLNGGGNTTGISNPPESTAFDTCVLNGLPSEMVLDTTGTYAYTILNASSTCPGSKTGIQAFKINSSGEVSASGSLVPFKNAALQVCESVGGVSQLVQESVPVVPQAIIIDSAGKFLYVSDAATTDSKGNSAPGAISVFSIGSGGSLTEVTNAQGSPFTVPPTCTTIPNFPSLAITPTVLPASVNGVQTAVCSSAGNNPPKSEFLYVADAASNLVWEFGVNTSTGALTNPPGKTQAASFATASVPSGVAVDPCDRFVYVSDFQSNQVNAYTICNGLPTQSPVCPASDGSLQPVAGSPFSLTSGSGPGPLVVDPFGKYVYVLDTQSNQITPFQIAPVSGALTAGTVAATGLEPKSIVIRGDDTWLFVSNYNSQTFSQFSITPATGALSALPTVPTDNYPWGIAVK